MYRRVALQVIAASQTRERTERRFEILLLKLEMYFIIIFLYIFNLFFYNEESYFYRCRYT